MTPRPAACLGRAPSGMELDRCVGQMKLGRTLGVDEFHVEALAFRSGRFRRAVFQAVKDMWRRAADARLGGGQGLAGCLEAG
eukprot:8531362-Pyramimonas_sp.AAC.1